jgi:hypothetical protein
MTSEWPLDKLPISLLLNGIGIKDVSELSEVLVELERAIAVICNLKLPPSALTMAEAPFTPHEMFVAKLVARDPHHGRAKVFTTNYDTLPEQAMDRLGVLYADGFTGTIDRRFNPSAYEIDLHYPGDIAEGRVRRIDKFLQLYKLHGSINWRRTKIAGQNPFGVTVDVRPLPTESEVISNPDLLSSVFPQAEGLAILPTAGKYGETLAMPYAHLFRLFAHALSQSQSVLLVVGYSGWDSHVNRIIEDGLTNPGFSCVILDPCPSAWARRLCSADFSGRVYLFGGEWGKFELFSEYVMPDLEILKTELKIAETIRELSRGDHNRGKVENAGGIQPE